MHLLVHRELLLPAVLLHAQEYLFLFSEGKGVEGIRYSLRNASVSVDS